jgi:peptidyl-prolyl cis-trans isomerase B (cyclophilin B)
MTRARIFSILTLTVSIFLTSVFSLPVLAAQADDAGKKKVETVTLHTSYGDIVIRLFAGKAPKTVKNFLQYAREGHYDNTLFHRVIPGFMIQGGGLEPGMREKPTHDPIRNEAENGLSNTVGTVAMARTSAPHSATAQFFINVANNASLNHTALSRSGWGYCVFGEVSEGMAVVNRIEAVPTTSRTGHRDVPQQDVIIKRVTVSGGE